MFKSSAGEAAFALLESVGFFRFLLIDCNGDLQVLSLKVLFSLLKEGLQNRIV